MDSGEGGSMRMSKGYKRRIAMLMVDWGVIHHIYTMDGGWCRGKLSTLYKVRIFKNRSGYVDVHRPRFS